MQALEVARLQGLLPLQDYISLNNTKEMTVANALRSGAALFHGTANDLQYDSSGALTLLPNSLSHSDRLRPGCVARFGGESPCLDPPFVWVAARFSQAVSPLSQNTALGSLNPRPL